MKLLTILTEIKQMGGRISVIGTYEDGIRVEINGDKTHCVESLVHKGYYAVNYWAKEYLESINVPYMIDPNMGTGTLYVKEIYFDFSKVKLDEIKNVHPISVVLHKHILYNKDIITFDMDGIKVEGDYVPRKNRIEFYFPYLNVKEFKEFLIKRGIPISFDGGQYLAVDLQYFNLTTE